MDVHIIFADNVVASIEEGKSNEMDALFPLDQSPFTNHQVKVTSYIFEDSFASLSEPMKGEFFHPMASMLQEFWELVLFIDVSFQDQLCFDFPVLHFFCLFKATVSII